MSMRRRSLDGFFAPSRCVSQRPFFVRAAAFPLSSPQKLRRAGVALGRAVCDEVAPGTGMPGLLNRLPLDRELSLDGSSFDGLPKGEMIITDPHTDEMAKTLRSVS
jgi:hypothetical protein